MGGGGARGGVGGGVEDGKVVHAEDVKECHVRVHLHLLVWVWGEGGGGGVMYVCVGGWVGGWVGVYMRARALWFVFGGEGGGLV